VPPRAHLLLRLPAALQATRVAAALVGLGASARVSTSEGLSVKGKKGSSSSSSAHEVALRATAFAIPGAPGVSVCEVRRSKGEARECAALHAQLLAALADYCIPV
jgi:hypothetical protein